MIRINNDIEKFKFQDFTEMCENLSNLIVLF